MITIGISSYNQQDFLPEAIESALDQTVKCEVIVVNDGSTDISLEIAKKYPVKIINQVNKGLSSARNTAIMNMTGEYFLPLDSDDILLEHCAERMQQAIDETNADIIAPSFKCFGVANNEVILGQIPTIKELISANRFPYFSAIKKDALLEIGGYNPKMIWGWEDWDLWIDLVKRSKTVCMLSDVLVLYRTKESSMYTESLKHSSDLQAQMIKNHTEVYDSIS